MSEGISVRPMLLDLRRRRSVPEDLPDRILLDGHQKGALEARFEEPAGRLGVGVSIVPSSASFWLAATRIKADSSGRVCHGRSLRPRQSEPVRPRPGPRA